MGRISSHSSISQEVNIKSTTTLVHNGSNLDVDMIKRFQSRARKDLTTSHNLTIHRESPENQKNGTATERAPVLVEPLVLNQVSSSDKTVKMGIEDVDRFFDSSSREGTARNRLKTEILPTVTLRGLNGKDS